MAGKRLPKSLFIGDNNECFCLQIVPFISKYLLEQIDWSIAPSNLSRTYPEILFKISNDDSIKYFIFDTSDSFDFRIIFQKLKSLQNGENYMISITKDNIVEIFNDFVNKKIVTDKLLDEETTSDILTFEDKTKKSKQSISKLADLFFNCLTDSDTYLHPEKRNILVSRGINIKVKSDLYKSFFSHFKKEYSPQELKLLTEHKDIIFAEIYRRRTGAFFTPNILVDESHKTIAGCLGPNWKEEYIVWDPTSGTANLTRNYNFKELYISTLEQADINTINDMGYNRGAIIFQYDFLNESRIDSVPDELKKAMEEKKKIIYCQINLTSL